MAKSTYRYALMLYREDGDPAGEVPVAVDWEAAEECTRFQAMRRGLLEPTELRTAVILPLWSTTAGAPYLRGFRVELKRSGFATVFHDFVTSYFKELALRASSEMVERGKLEKGEVFRYRPLAFPLHDEPDGRRFGFVAEEVIPPVPIRSTALESLASAGAVMGEPRE